MDTALIHWLIFKTYYNVRPGRLRAHEKNWSESQTPMLHDLRKCGLLPSINTDRQSPDLAMPASQEMKR